MYKMTETYTDYDGNERTEDFYFHVTKAEIMEMDFLEEGGLQKTVERITATQDRKALMELFKGIVIMAYGEKSPDGRRFMKNEEIKKNFPNRAKCLVAVENNKVVGTTSIDKLRGDTTGEKYMIQTVFVKMENHHQGIGKMLMAEIEKSAKEIGAKQLIILASIYACEFYRKLGYDYLDSKKGSLTPAFIVNHSKNIIDLVEAGDYVNGKEVIEVRNQNGKIYLMTGYVPQSYIKDEIKSILTKEQFNQNSYKVVE
mgnify:CR=1 FL=1